MPKVEIDIDTFMSAMQQALLAAATKPVKAKSKKKSKPVKVESEPITHQESPQIDDGFTVAAKGGKKTTDDDGRVFMRKVPFKKKIRLNQFEDNLSLAKKDLYNSKGELVKDKYPAPTDRRDEQKEYTYTCDVCHNKFQAYPSYIPPRIEGHQPQIRCYSCNTK